MDFGKAFTYPFQDPDWARKIIIPALILLIPIIGQIFIIGWTLDIARRVIRRDPNPLPELNFGEQLIDGLKAFVVGLVYALPTIVVSITLGIITGMASSPDLNNEAVTALVSIVSVCCYGIILLYSLLLVVVVPAAYTRMVAANSLGEAFNFSEVFGLLRAAPGAWLLVFVGSILTGMVASLGMILCIIGVVLTYAYSMAVNGHLYGQAYNESIGNRAIGT